MDSLMRLHAQETRFGKFVARTALWLALCAAALLALMVLVTFTDVVGRYFFNRPITGSNEIIYCLMGLLVFLGLGLTTYEGGHVRVDVVTSQFYGRGRAVLDVIAHSLSLITAILISWRLSVYAYDQVHELNETQVLALPVWLVAVIMSLCSLMLVLGLFVHLFRAIRAVFNQAKSPS